MNYDALKINFSLGLVRQYTMPRSISKEITTVARPVTEK
jgi:hypothetical protein